MKTLVKWNMASKLACSGLAIVLGTGAAQGQAQPSAAIHGHVNDPTGTPLKGGDVKLTQDKSSEEKSRVYKFTFPISATGDYKGAGIPPGEWLANVQAGGKVADYQIFTVKAGDDKAVDFDMSREEYLKSMTPEARKEVEEYKKKNAGLAADNAKIANINKTLVQAREDEKNGKAEDAVKSLQGIVDLRPTEPIIWASLGEAQLSLGDQGLKAARAAKTSTSDPAVTKPFTESATSYQKAIDLSAPPAKVNPEQLAAYYLNLGQALAKSGKTTEAGQAYESSAKTAPAKASTAFFNEAVVYYTAGKNTEAVSAADKAIAADPKRADAYYIKGQALIPGAKEDPATHKFVLPPGCLEAYQEYLDIAPDGPHAAEIKELLGGLGQPVKNSFKAGKK